MHDLRNMDGGQAMKQIFDWMREQMRLSLDEPQYLHDGEDFYNGIIHAEEVINEAEAKWESECCEHKWNKEYWWYDTSCRHILEPHGYNFCPYCGKPIKISEVE